MKIAAAVLSVLFLSLGFVRAETPVTNSENGKEVFAVCEKMPEYPGGMDALMKYLVNNMRWPDSLAENAIQGLVICQFIVAKDGSIRDIELVRSLHEDLDREAVRLIKNMPKWIPGEENGKIVECRYTLPIKFALK